MNRLYLKLMATNMKNGKQFYFPYILAGMIIVMLFYSMMGIYYNDGLSQMVGGSDVKMILNFGIKVVKIFSFIFIFYTNSFIMKRRKKDIGIYNILGMEKRHIAKELLAETVTIALAAIVGGLITGILFNKFFMMFLYKILSFDTSIKFAVSGHAVYDTIILFAILYASIMIYNIMQVRLSNPIELLRGGNVGEKEPKTKILMTVTGFVCIGIGYYIAITTENPLKALMLFFVAVVLVIIGTYCLFMAGSIAFLKLLRNNRKYYYKKKHFMAVSGMLYRMKQNSVGLANICILSTMVLVMISTTVSMYIGEDDALNTRYMTEISISADTSKVTNDGRLKEVISDEVKANGRKVTDIKEITKFSVTGYMENNEFKLYTDTQQVDYSKITMMSFMTRQEYENLYGVKIRELKENEAELFGEIGLTGDQFNVFKEKYIIRKVSGFSNDYDTMMVNVVGGCGYIVVENYDVLKNIRKAAERVSNDKPFYYTYELYMDIDGTREQKKECDKAVYDKVSKIIKENKKLGYVDITVDTKESSRQSFYVLYGGLFFLGIFLGAMFLMITVLIIFYKQISEGYEDKERFVIMEKVGMSKKDVKLSIRSQIRTVFLLPILVAAVHVTAAFPLIKRLLLMLNMSNSVLYAKCIIATILIFVLIYIAVFMITSRTYYKIVGNENR